MEKCAIDRALEELSTYDDPIARLDFIPSLEQYEMKLTDFMDDAYQGKSEAAGWRRNREI